MFTFGQGAAKQPEQPIVVNDLLCNLPKAIWFQTATSDEKRTFLEIVSNDLRSGPLTPREKAFEAMYKAVHFIRGQRSGHQDSADIPDKDIAKITLEQVLAGIPKPRPSHLRLVTN